MLDQTMKICLLAVEISTLLSVAAAVTNLDCKFSIDGGANIVFGEVNTLTMDITVTPNYNDLSTAAELKLEVFLTSGGSADIHTTGAITEKTVVVLTSAQQSQALVPDTDTVLQDVSISMDLSASPGCYDSNGYQSPYIIMCMNVDKASDADEPIIIPDVYCRTLTSCKSIITLTADPTVAATTGSDLDVIYGTSKDFTLDITMVPTAVDADTTATFSGPGNALFDVSVYLAEADGTNSTVPVSGTIAVTTASVQPAVNVALAAVTASLTDLSGLDCVVSTQVCVDIVPADGAAWQWGTTAMNPRKGCVDVVCTSEIEVDPLPMVNTSSTGDLDVVMGTEETFNLDITLATGHNTAKIEKKSDELFVVSVYLAKEDDGDFSMTSPSDGTVTQADVIVEPNVKGGDNVVVVNVVATCDLDTLNCDDFSYVCVDINSDDTTMWKWKNADTDVKTACVAITSCQGEIVGTAALTANSGAGEDLILVMGPERPFNLDVAFSVTGSSATVDANGDDMFYIQIYLASDDAGADPSTKVNATNLPTGATELSEDTGLTTLSDIQATLDLDGLACADFTHVCADISPKVDSPNEPWKWSNDVDLKTACVAISTTTACSIEVTEDTITIASDDLDIQMGSTKTFVLAMTLTSAVDTGELALAANALFDVQVYLAADDAGGTPSTKEDADTLPTDVVTIDTTVTTGPVTITATDYSLADYACVVYTHVCIDISPVDVQWTWASGDALKTACTQLGTCTSVITAGVSITATVADRNVRMGTNELFTLAVSIPVVDFSAVVTGPEASLFYMEVYLSDDNIGTTPSEKFPATITSTENGITMSVAETPADIDSVTVHVNLDGQNCDDYAYVCVDVKPHELATWEWQDVAKDPKKACDTTEITCTSQITANSVTLASNAAGDLDLVMGTSKAFHLDVTIVTGTETGKIDDTADNLFAVKVYLAESGGQSGATSVKEDATVQAVEVTIDESSEVSIADVTVGAYDLLGLGCADFSFICVDVSPATDSGWVWSTGGDTFHACVDVATCSSVLNPATTTPLVLTGANGDIVVAMGASDTFQLDIAVSTESTLTGKVVGNANELFAVNVYLAQDNSGTGFTTKTPATVPATSFTIKDASQQVIADIEVTLDLSSVECAGYTHVCADVSPTTTTSWTWYNNVTPAPACAQIAECTTAPTITTSFANNGNGDLAVVMGESKVFHFDITVTLSLGDAVTGTNLYVINAYLATDASGSNPKPSLKAAATISDNDIGFSDGTPAVLTDVTASMDLTNDITCQQSATAFYTHVCIDLSASSSAAPTWSMTSASTTTTCVQLTPACQSQPLLVFSLSNLAIKSPSNKRIITGENNEVTCDVDVALTAESDAASGDSNWKIEGFLATSTSGAGPIGKVPATTTSMSTHVGQNVNPASAYTFSDVVVNLPLGQAECGNLQYYCIELTQASEANWYFDAFDPSSNVVCSAITCTTDAANLNTLHVLLGIISLFVTVWNNV